MNDLQNLQKILKDKSVFSKLSLREKEKKLSQLLSMFDSGSVMSDIKELLGVLKKTKKLTEETLLFYYSMIKDLITA